MMRKSLAAVLAATLTLAIAILAALGAGWFDGAPATRASAQATPVTPSAARIAIAPLGEALTFARDDAGRTFAVFSYERGRIEAAPLGDGEDAISFIGRLGYDGAKAQIESLSVRVVLDAASLGLPVDLGDRHIAVGTNYRQHAEEASVEGGPFLFPKYVRPTPPRAAIPAGDALLDYEVELCLVAIRPIAGGEKAQGGLVLCNDVTDRATLLRHLDPEDPESGDGFTSGKSAPGYLPVGDLFVAPRDLAAFVGTLTLQLSVNGAERQRAPATLWIWDFDRILDEARAQQGREWAYRDGAARLPFDDEGAIPARTMILAGTPGGTVFKGIYKSAYARGLARWIAGGFRGGVASHVIESHISAAKKRGDYLQQGDLVTIEVDRLGALANSVE